MNDILIFSNDVKAYSDQTRHVLQWLQEHDLFVKPEKCVFDIIEVNFLRMTISPRQVHMDKDKLLGIADWHIPTKVKNMERFMGLANYYSHFI